MFAHHTTTLGGPRVKAMEWFYTAPLEDIAVRRGDPLGMRAVAEDMAEVLAPGLSNRTMDGRWLSIMCWALQQSYSAWQALGAIDDDGHLVTREAAQEVYSWLRPLELLWLARTVAKTKDRGKGRQLPGVRAVRHWIDGDVDRERFGFAPSSYAQYRFTGVYGAYRVALRSLPGLTIGGDGWRLSPLGCELAEVVYGEVQCGRMHRRRKGKRPVPERYWEQLFKWDFGQSEFLPTVLAKPRPLPKSEQLLVRRALFSPDREDIDRRDGRRRRAVVEAAAKSSATTRPGLFADVVRELGGGNPLDELALLSPFAELADAGVAAMNACWAAAGEGDESGFARTSDVLARPEVAKALDGLVAASKRWQRDSSSSRCHIQVADALAASVLAAGSNRMRQFQSLERHHNQFGGGLKWLALEGDKVKPLAPIGGGDASEYRFRIGALSRLGVQAGIIAAMPQGLRDYNELDEEGGEGDQS